MVEGIARSSFVTTYNQPLTKKTPSKHLPGTHQISLAAQRLLIYLYSSVTEPIQRWPTKGKIFPHVQWKNVPLC